MNFEYLYATLFLLWFCEISSAELNDGHYSEEDDAKVLPIVLPIVLIVLLACVVGCCWQGKKCPCNKNNKDLKKKRQEMAKEKDENAAADRKFAENEKKKRVSSPVRDRPPGKTVTHFNQHLPPAYSAYQKKSNLPGHKSSVKSDHVTVTSEVTSHKKQSHHSTRSQETSGYDATEYHTGGRRIDEKHRVIDGRSHKSSRDGSRSNGRVNEGYRNSYEYHNTTSNGSNPHPHQDYHSHSHRHARY
ncbi:uncharacterized protein LOC120329495 [Styela clava]|uniref:uncharacterized protein LOC120329495 n=1 Tax=Styela clava TaxID=7725 RepID=UPI00193A6B65|nr:uncharacterized protein LOC120329495 [Styela clava]